MPSPDDSDAPPATEPPPAAEPPATLDYFAAHAPDRRQSRATIACSFTLALGFVPYLCGILNALVVARSYTPEIAASHVSGAAVFLGLGILLSVVALAGFYRLRQWTGVIAAVLVLGAQLSVAACLGVVRAASAS